MLENILNFVETGSFAAVLTCLILALVGGAWALAERKSAAMRLERLHDTVHQLQATVQFRDALLQAMPESLVVLPTRARKMIAFREGRALLEQCLAGPDAARLAVAMRRLLMHREAFALDVRMTARPDIAVRGQPIADGVALFFRPGAATLTPRGRPAPAAANDDGPQSTRPSIVLGADGRLNWYSRSFAEKCLPPDADLGSEPHVSAVAALCAGPSAIWDIVASAASDDAPERYGAWGAQVGANGERVALSFSRRSDGSTLVFFASDAQPSLAVGA